MKSAFFQNLSDRTEYRDMVRWFSPKVFLKTLKNVLPSTLFGQYADRRLVHAALDSPIDPEKIIEECCGGAKGICGESDKSEFWVDYVADLGDGWNSTYAVAYLLGKEAVKVGNETLPRGDCLIMGGDEIYPYAERDEYNKRMRRAYKAAFPQTKREGAAHPPVYMIPGNHDWYDGLSLFLALFCRGRATELGSWLASQRRSYFATHLGGNWWIWGFDSQLGEDVDKPQADYFSEVARQMKPNAKVIICASVPTWLRASLTARNKEQRDSFYRGLDYIAGIVRDGCQGAKVPLVLSGDLHHYTRYVDKEAGTNFINAGGGGAFLHPTHRSIEDTIPMRWARNDQTLEIGRDGGVPEAEKAIYPPQDVSQKLAKRNILFFWNNPDFCYMLLGPLYLICSLLMLAWNGYGATGGTGIFAERVWNQLKILAPTPVFLIILIGLSWTLISIGDIRSTVRRRTAGLVHSLFHVATLLLGTALVSTIVAGLQAIPVIGDIAYFIAFLLGMIALGFVGGVWWGLYMTIVSYYWGDESNNAFSALGLDCYKNFLRIRIEGNKLTVYPIGIDKVPTRDDWRMNDLCEDEDQNTPVIVPKNDIGHHLIERPIIIDLENVVTIKSI